MANRLSLQSATCSAFQLQLCRQPHNENDTKTISSFGSDCTRAMQSPPRNPTTWWAITRLQLIHRLCLCLCENSMKECMCLFSCVSVYICLCAVQYRTMHVWACEGRSVLLFCSDVSLLLRGALHSCYLHIRLQLREGQTQVQALNGDQCAPLERSCHWAHLYRETKELIVRWCGISCTVVLRYSISLWVFFTTLWLWLLN